MPYMPYWFESLGFLLPWAVPCIAISGLWIAKCSDNLHLQRSSERVYFAAMLLVAWAALRTIIANEGCWLMHMSSIGLMVLGGIYPASEPIHSEIELENEIMLS